MNTYVPLPDLNENASVLDDKRLNKQRADILAILTRCFEEPAEDEHPSITMWRGNEGFLINYGIAICIEYQARGNIDNTLKKIIAFKSQTRDTEPPEWWGGNIHSAHRSYLLRALPSHYKVHFPHDSDDMPMVWPRSPEKQRKSPDQKDHTKLVLRAQRMKDKYELAKKQAIEACNVAGLDFETLQPLEGGEFVEIKTPDADLLEL